MYVELHCHSCFSLLDGVSRPEELVSRAAALDMPALALTDHDALYGAVSFWRAARAAGIKPILGAELTVQAKEGRRGHLTLLAMNGEGYANLSRLITGARMRCTKGEAESTWEELAAHSRGLIALSGCRQGEIAGHLVARQPERAAQVAYRLQELFGADRFFLEVQQQLRPGDTPLVRELAALAGRHKLPLVITNNVHYATRDGHRLHDVLVSIRHLSTLDDSHHRRRGNSEAHLKGAAEMGGLFPGRPDALVRTLDIAGRCHVDLHQGVQMLPPFPVPMSGPDGIGPAEASTAASGQLAYLRRLCEVNLVERYGAQPGERPRQMLAHELTVIARLGLANYFLIVWDIVRFARSQGIRCQGRGSAANSLVAFLLGITPIDPLAHDLVFERFLSEERGSLPDIDIDFDAARREEVIQYVYERYGRQHAAMACTLVTYRGRSAVRDVGRALGFAPELIDALAGAVDRRGLEEAWQEVSNLQSPTSNFHHPSWQLLLRLCTEIQGLPRHLGIHNGGMVLSGPPLAEIVPLEPATMADRTVCQWDKDSLEDAGLVKIDLLGLRMLAALEEALDIVEQISGRRPELDRLSFDDPAVYDMLCRGDTIGCFQVESRAQAQLVPRFRPRCFNDLVVEISLIRPGPIQGNMVQPYLRRRWGQEPVTYRHPLLAPALAETMGVIVFQEQVLKVARDLAGFSGGQGELLRRALGHKHGQERLEKLRGAFIAGAAQKRVPADAAAAVFEQLKAFGGYAFAKSHAASFAVIVYQSAWLKCYHRAAFTVALLNNQPMGFWSPAVLVNDAKRHDITVLPADVNDSGVYYEVVDEDLPGGAIRVGLAAVKGLGERGAERIVLARASTTTPFISLADFCRRTRLPRALVENLIMAGALDGMLASDKRQAAAGSSSAIRPAPLPTRRRELLWQLGLLHYAEDTLLLHEEPEPAPAELPPLRPLEALAEELRVAGVSAGDHVMAHHRAEMARRGVLSSRELAGARQGQTVWVAGQVTVVQAPPTAKGFMFVTLEDEFGMIDVIVRPDVVARYRRVWRQSPLLAVLGRVQREGEKVNLLAQRPWRIGDDKPGAQAVEWDTALS